MTTDRPVGFYYGSGKLERLTRFDRVVLQPDAYTPVELAQLRGEGTLPLAYLSLSEDVGPPAPWQPGDLPDLLALITTLRGLPRSGYVLANRGFAMLPQLAEVVDGILFESFSARWTDSCIPCKTSRASSR